jgi:hypothetical protein
MLAAPATLEGNSMKLRLTSRRRAATIVLVMISSAVLLAGAASATSHRSAGVIRSLTVSGSASRPIFTISGAGLAVPPPNPKVSPSNQTLCPLRISGNAGFDYGTSFYLIGWDAQVGDTNSQLYAAGRYRPALNELDCIGIVVLTHTPTHVTFTFGHAYVQYYRSKPRLLHNGDVIEVVLGRASFATVFRLR